MLQNKIHVKDTTRLDEYVFSKMRELQEEAETEQKQLRSLVNVITLFHRVKTDNTFIKLLGLKSVGQDVFIAQEFDFVLPILQESIARLVKRPASEHRLEQKK
jgi:hypothetical protein